MIIKIKSQNIMIYKHHSERMIHIDVLVQNTGSPRLNYLKLRYAVMFLISMKI